VAETVRYSSAHRAIVKAITALNFNETDKAIDILLAALTDSNSEIERKKSDVIASA
jgi:hypothetical protein